MVVLPVGRVTLLFADIEGSTRLVQDLGDEYATVLQECRRLLRTAVAANDGFEVDCRADERFAVFQEADAAVTAAVGAQSAIAAHPWPDGLAVRVRIGLHTGQPSIEGDAYLGLDVSRAARICSAGHGGQTLLSASTRDLLASHTQVTDLGTFALAGVPDPERLFQLRAPGLPSRFPPPRVDSAGGPRVSGRLLARLPRPSRQPSVGDLAWHVRSLLPTAERSLRRPLAQLGASLFTAQRAADKADSFLARADRRRIERRLADKREQAVVSPRAQEEVDACEARLDAIDNLVDRRRAVDVLAAEVSRDLVNLRSGERIGALRERVAASTDELDAAVTAAAARLDSASFRLQRTRRRGVYRFRRFFVVRYFDELGTERQREFTTFREARDFREAIRLAEKAHEAENDGRTPPSVNVYSGE